MMLLLAAIAWCSATAGGAATRDMAMTTVLVAAARAASPSLSDPASPRRSVTRPAPATVALLVLIGWLVAVGISDAAALVDVVRLPWLVCVAALAAATGRRMPAVHQDTALAALALLGGMLAALGLGHWLWVAHTTDLPLTGIRADAPLGYANALGAVLLTTALLTYRALRTRFGRLGIALLALQSVSVVATGSRLVLLVGTAVAAWYAVRGRERSLQVMAVVWSIAAAVVIAFRFATAPNERLPLWAGALRVISHDPITGRGPTPQVIDPGAASVRPTTHAHNEVIQLALEYGLVGVLLAGTALYLGLRLVRLGRPLDWPLLLGVMGLAALSLTDFALRVPAVALMLATLAGIASSRSEQAQADSRAAGAHSRRVPSHVVPGS